MSDKLDKNAGMNGSGSSDKKRKSSSVTKKSSSTKDLKNSSPTTTKSDSPTSSKKQSLKGSKRESIKEPKVDETKKPENTSPTSTKQHSSASSRKQSVKESKRESIKEPKVDETKKPENTSPTSTKQHSSASSRKQSVKESKRESIKEPKVDETKKPENTSPTSTKQHSSASSRKQSVKESKRESIKEPKVDKTKDPENTSPSDSKQHSSASSRKQSVKGSRRESIKEPKVDKTKDPENTSPTDSNQDSSASSRKQSVKGSKSESIKVSKKNTPNVSPRDSPDNSKKDTKNASLNDSPEDNKKSSSQSEKDLTTLVPVYKKMEDNTQGIVATVPVDDGYHTVNREWKDENAKEELISRVKTVLSSIPETAKLSSKVYTLLCKSLAIDYMSTFKRLDPQGIEWIINASRKELFKLLKKHSGKKSDPSIKALAIDDPLTLPMVPAPLETLQPPISCLISKATYLQDSYYYRRLHLPNSRRQNLEDILESRTFLHPGRGTIRVMCAVPVKSGATQKELLRQFAVVARDWTGAYCFFLIDESKSAGEAPKVHCAYPLLSHVEFPVKGFTGITMKIDGHPFVLSFQDQGAATYLHDCLKIAMCAMYGLGNDHSRIVTMRALSVEFSASDPTYFPCEYYRDVPEVCNEILTEKERYGAEMDALFMELRSAMRTMDGRDSALRLWFKSIDNLCGVRFLPNVVLNNHLRFIEDALRAPVFHDDITIPERIPSYLSPLASGQPRDICQRVNEIIMTSKLLAPIMKTHVSRFDMGDVPYERFFEPEEGSQAAKQAKQLINDKKEAFSRLYTPPGIYLTVLPYCQDKILCLRKSPTFISELVQSHPSDDELEVFGPNCDSFRWAIRLGGYSETWSSDQNLSDMLTKYYNTVGQQGFRSRFLRAAVRLKTNFGLPLLGMIFDTPVVQKEVGCAHIICTLRVNTMDRLPMDQAVWRDISTIENDVYVKSLSAWPGSRIDFLSCSHRNCVRFIKAAIDARESIDYRPDPGFYLGHIVLNMSSTGTQLLVPECNRHLPPLVKVCDYMPTMEQWRWIQTLNERMRRNESFGFPEDLDAYPDSFEKSFARSARDLEKAIGTPVNLFFDYDIFILDEAQMIRAVFAVSIMPSNYFSPSTENIDNSSFLADDYISRRRGDLGLVPMCLRSCDTFEHAFLSIMWPKLYTSFNTEHNARLEQGYTGLQLYAPDEVLRYRNETFLSDQFELDKFLYQLSWLRPITTWFKTDRRSIVVNHGGDDSYINSRNIDVTVDTAILNYASYQDVNLVKMRSILMEAAQAPHFSFTTLMSRLRELERLSIHANECKPTPPPKEITLGPLGRNYDEVYEDDLFDDAEHTRQAAVYHLPCTLEELVMMDMEPNKALNYFMMQDIVRDLVDEACIEAVEVGIVKEVGSILNDTISVIEVKDDIVDCVHLISLKDETEDIAMRERTKYMESWLAAFLGSGGEREVDAMGNTEEADTGIVKGVVDAYDGATPLFYEGSTQYIGSFDDGIKVCIAKSMQSHYQLQQLLSVATSSIEALELVNTVQDFSNALSKRDTLLGTVETGVKYDTTDLMFAACPNDSLLSTTNMNDLDQGRSVNEVVLVSKEFDEFIVPSGDYIRSQLVSKLKGKVRFQSVVSSNLEIIAAHLQCPQYRLPNALRRLDFPVDRAHILINISMKFKTPLLTLRIASILFASRAGSEEYFTAPAVVQMEKILAKSFLFDYTVEEWLTIEALGGEAIAAAIDVMWFVRLRKECLDEIEKHNNSNYSNNEGAWKQVFAEGRVKAFLSNGAPAITTQEAGLWREYIGRYVEYLSFREKTNISDAEVDILVDCCPNLKSLDLSYTGITDRTINVIIGCCNKLVECSVAGTGVNGRQVDALRRHCTENKHRK